jgi:hypothetical protein
MNRLYLVAIVAAVASAGPALAGQGHGKPSQQGNQGPAGYGVGGCPPGLAKKNPECMPPGRYKKLFEVGQRVPPGYPGLIAYNQLPTPLRDRYGPALDPRARYIYDRQYIYRVDPATMAVSHVLNTVLHP